VWTTGVDRKGGVSRSVWSGPRGLRVEEIEEGGAAAPVKTERKEGKGGGGRLEQHVEEGKGGLVQRLSSQGVSGGTSPGAAGAGSAVQHNTGEARAADTWTPTTVPVCLKPYPIRFKRIKRFSN
jgi:hypothetical protein